MTSRLGVDGQSADKQDVDGGQPRDPGGGSHVIRHGTSKMSVLGQWALPYLSYDATDLMAPADHPSRMMSGQIERSKVIPRDHIVRTTGGAIVSETPSGWAAGYTFFAGVVLILIGLFQAFVGLVAVINDEFYVVGVDYTLQLDVTTWGWIHLIVGIIVLISEVLGALCMNNELALPQRHDHVA
ncbi:MAG TPA: hypothetical protein VL068_10105, partial [Microthrixaceae bacterium]|nr:hypothetical protein [Microthrixaceae bacterium]